VQAAPSDARQILDSSVTWRSPLTTQQSRTPSPPPRLLVTSPNMMLSTLRHLARVSTRVVFYPVTPPPPRDFKWQDRRTCYGWLADSQWTRWADRLFPLRQWKRSLNTCEAMVMNGCRGEVVRIAVPRQVSAGEPAVRASMLAAAAAPCCQLSGRWCNSLPSVSSCATEPQNAAPNLTNIHYVTLPASNQVHLSSTLK